MMTMNNDTMPATTSGFMSVVDEEQSTMFVDEDGSVASSGFLPEQEDDNNAPEKNRRTGKIRVSFVLSCIACQIVACPAFSKH